MNYVTATLNTPTCEHTANCPCETRETLIRVHYDPQPDHDCIMLVFDDDVQFEDANSAIEWMETTDEGEAWLRDQAIIRGLIEA